MKVLKRILRWILGGRDEPAPGPGPEPEPAPIPLPFQCTFGRAVFQVVGLNALPLSSVSDDFVLFCLMWEPLFGEPDPTVPVLGVHVRGTSAASRGFLTRWMPNAVRDRRVYDANHDAPPTAYFGGGQNYHNRKPCKDGLWVVEWRPGSIDVVSPDGYTQRMVAKVNGSVGFGNWTSVLWPRDMKRYHLWSGFEAKKHGVFVSLVDWQGTPGELVRIKSEV